MQLYEALDVKMVTTNGAGSYCDPETRKPYFTYRNFVLPHWNISIPYVSGFSLLSAKSCTSFGTVLFDLLRFLKEVRKDRLEGRLRSLTFGDYLTSRGYSSLFIDTFIVPFFTSMYSSFASSLNLLLVAILELLLTYLVCFQSFVLAPAKV
jgi:hypothetical protein